MQVRPEQLGKHLDGDLSPIYLISGDEPLLVQEACDAVIAAARDQGYSEREILNVDTGFRWSELLDGVANLSLFARRRILDVRLPPKRLDREASEVIRGYLDAPAEDVLLLLRTERLLPQQRRSAWFKAIEKTGTVVLVWPIGVAEMQRWIATRCGRAGLELEGDAISFFSQRMEGNLLAAVQEIEKLKLLDLPQPMTLAALQDAVLDASHYDAFDAIDAALAGQGRRVRRIVAVLRQEGVQPLAVHGAIVGQLRRMIEGVTAGVPPQRERLLRDAARRLSRSDLEAILIESAEVDRRVKGLSAGDPWRALETVLLRFAGAAISPPVLARMPTA